MKAIMNSLCYLSLSFVCESENISKLKVKQILNKGLIVTQEQELYRGRGETVSYFPVIAVANYLQIVGGSIKG